MIQFKAALIGVSVVFLIFGLFASFKRYKLKFKNSLNMKNYFPFEINFRQGFKENIIGNIFILLSGACLLTFFILFDSKHTDGYLTFNMIGGAIAIISGITLFFLATVFLKTHILFMVILSAFAFLLPSSLLIDSLRLFQQNPDVLYIIVMVLSGIIVLGVFALLINPKLSFRMKPVEMKTPDGKSYLARPKFIWIAFTEWLLIFSIYLSAIITFIISFTIQ